MSEFDPLAVLLQAFLGLRRSGFVLGVSELLAAREAIEGGWPAANAAELRQLVELLWCNSLLEAREIDVVWSSLGGTTAPSPGGVSGETGSTVPPEAVTPPNVEIPAATLPQRPAAASRSAPDFSALPVRAPFVAAPLDDIAELDTYWPVSRRFMTYAWRYLRRPIADGPADVLDVEGTVQTAARQGFFLTPLYRRRERNYAHLVLLLDQDGSMTPFHRFTRDMVETARDESDIERLDVFYFHNSVAGSVYLDVHMTNPIVFEQMLAQCSADTSVLLVSDAGAARGYRRLERIRATTGFLARLKQHTSLLAWLNPMPQNRWPSTSAQIIAHLCPMFQMDPDGFSSAIDLVRGQPLRGQPLRHAS